MKRDLTRFKACCASVDLKYNKVHINIVWVPTNVDFHLEKHPLRLQLYSLGHMLN